MKKKKQLIKRFLNVWEPASLSASAPCLCMPGSVGILPPTASSCSSSLAHTSTPRSAWFAWAPTSPPPRPWDPLARFCFVLFCFILGRPERGQPLDGPGRDEWLNRSQPAVRHGRLHGYLMRGCLPRWKSCESESSLQASGMASPPTPASYRPSESFISPWWCLFSQIFLCIFSYLKSS